MVRSEASPDRRRRFASGRRPLAALLACAAAIAASSARAEAVLHAGRFSDGGIVPQGPIAKWHATAAQPTFADRAMFDPGNPLRWAIRLNRPPAPALPAGGYVELVTGDRLPGMVEGYRSGRESLGERLPPHLLVRPTMAGPPGQPEPDVIRVRTAFVHRIVREPRPGRAVKPGSLRLAGGREVEFRSLRWSSQGVLVLTSSGPAKFTFAEIDELRLPDADAWSLYYDMVATLTPDLTDRLVRCEMADGLIVTTALRRIAASGSENEPASWEHRLEPAWSLDPVRVRHATVDVRWFFPPQEVPLPLVAPARVERRAVFGGSWNWERNRSVRGTPLAAGGKPYGWGFGVQAACDLSFPLPAIATGFRSGLALDEAAGRGGCAKGLVRLDSSAAPPLWQSGLLVGTGEPGDTGLVALQPKPDGSSLLVLSAAEAHQERPPGADPFDIRDTLDWLDPVVVLDPSRLAETIRARLPGTIPAWDGWTLTLPPGAMLTVKDVAAPGGAVRQIGPTTGELVLARSIECDERAQFLMLGVGRWAGSSGSRVEIRIDGQPVAAADVPERPADALPTAYRLPLAGFAGRTVKVEIVHKPADANGLIAWHCLDTVGSLASVWEPLEIVEAVSEGGATFRKLEDGSVLAEGPSPQTDAITVRMRTSLEGITALRIDVLGHESLPGGGPGRFSNGNFVLTGIEADAFSVEPPARRTPLAFTAAVATHQGPRFPAAAIIDGSPASGWAGEAHAGAVMLVLDGQAGFPGGTDLVVKLFFRHGPLPQHVLGRFRMSATTSATPTLEPPGKLLEAAVAPR